MQQKIIGFGVTRSIYGAGLCLIAALSLPYLTASPTIAAELAEIERRGTLIVGVKDNLRPLAFTDATGNLEGLEIDIAKRLAAEILGSPDAIKLQPVTNQERLNAVIEGKVDLAIARVTFTESRDRLVDFSRYYYLDGTGLVTKDPAIQTLSDLQNRKIAVIRASSTIATIKYSLPKAQLIGVDSYQEAWQLLETGAANAFAADNSVLTGWVQGSPQYHLLPERLSGEPLAIVMPTGLQYASLRRKVNEAIANWQESGWLQERISYWGLP
ncbi:MAG: transporter substrate-binding domain-containing protein [Oscillatoria sp. PMC 1068.18]|nr:transporter substrate-binding domain-containing protein [Oscillatoria sp. PMC 1076.18]MEC4989398.1 transporter substrate-binding domain-containing protein [Oscillatoria sp. PMC 1068.18]